MFELDSETSSQFMSLKVEHDSLCQAIKMSKSNSIDEKIIQSLVLVKQNVKNQFLTLNQKILRKIPRGTNIVKIDENWYGVRYISDKEATLKIDILREKDIYILERDEKKRDLSRSEIDSLMPAIVDTVALELFKQHLHKRACEIVYDYSGLQLQEVPEVEGDECIKVSSHAGMRWVQRKYGIGAINELQAEEYRKTHLNKIESEIISAYGNAEILWEGFDGISYWFDEENMMYVVGNNNIITLYEEDFGFTKEINRSIVYQQVEVLRKAQSSLSILEQQFVETMEMFSREQDEISGKIRVLEAEIELLAANKTLLSNKTEELNRSLRLAHERATAEFNKLFKKWDK